MQARKWNLNKDYSTLCEWCKKYNWDNYYFPDDVRKIFEEEIFGFLKNIKEILRKKIMFVLKDEILAV